MPVDQSQYIYEPWSLFEMTKIVYFSGTVSVQRHPLRAFQVKCKPFNNVSHQKFSGIGTITCKIEISHQGSLDDAFYSFGFVRNR